MPFPTEFIIVGVRCTSCGVGSKHRNRVCHRCGGEVDKIREPNPRWSSLEDRFRPHVRKGKDCWLWIGYVNPGGYGQLGHRYAHRLSYELNGGVIPKGYDVHHTCNNKRCVNPKHLIVVTKKVHTEIDNKHAAFVNRSKSKCPQGHPYDNKNTYTDKSGHRHCIICKHAAFPRWRRKTPRVAAANKETLFL